MCTLLLFMLLLLLLSLLLQAEAVLRAALATLEKAWLITAAGGTGCAPLCQEGDGMFLGGLTQISVADIQVGCWVWLTVRDASRRSVWQTFRWAAGGGWSIREGWTVDSRWC